jgi:hypothetical protein
MMTCLPARMAGAMLLSQHGSTRATVSFSDSLRGTATPA